MSGVSLTDRIVSVFAYLTLGIASIIWIIYSNLTKKSITPFLSFNLYQAIFLSVALTAISLIYSFAINILFVIPYLGKFIEKVHIFFNSTPIYYGFTITSFILVILLAYLGILSLLGKRPYIPIISNIINCNFGG